MATLTKDITTITVELADNVKRIAGLQISNTPSTLFSSQETALQVTAGRIYVLVSNAMQEIKDIMLALSDKEYKDSINMSLIKHLEKLGAFYEEIAANNGKMKRITEFSNRPMFEPFATLIRRAEQLSQIYAGVS